MGKPHEAPAGRSGLPRGAACLARGGLGTWHGLEGLTICRAMGLRGEALKGCEAADFTSLPPRGLEDCVLSDGLAQTSFLLLNIRQ